MLIHVEDFQSLADVSIEVEGLTVIVGRTNLGKSALIRAISGALFNRPGDTFVRTGAKLTRVTITGAPVYGSKDTIDIVWEKGSGTNRFFINGEKSSSVGKSVPQALLDAGYRTIDIGEGTPPLRPQIAGQFDGPFLLGISGNTVSDVLTRASRLDVLLRAGAACTRDLRSTRQLLGVRRNDLTKAEKVLDAILAPAAELRERTDALMAQSDATLALGTRRDQLTRLVHRQRVLRAAVVELGAVDRMSVTVLWGLATNVTRLHMAVDRYRALGPVAVASLPASKTAYVPKVIAKATKAAKLRAQWLRRMALGGVAQQVLAPPAAYYEARLPLIRMPLKALLPRYLALRKAHVELPPRVKVDVETPAAHVRALRPLTIDWLSLIAMERTTEAASNAAGVEAEEAMADVENALRENGICPVCKQEVT